MEPLSFIYTMKKWNPIEYVAASILYLSTF